MSRHLSEAASFRSQDSTEDYVPQVLLNDEADLEKQHRNSSSQFGQLNISLQSPDRFYDENLVERIKSTLLRTSSTAPLETLQLDPLQRQATRQTIVKVLLHRVNDQVSFYDDQKLAINSVVSIKDSDSQVDEKLPTKADGTEFASLDPELVTWNTENDPLHPRNWKQSKKLLNLLIVGLYTFSGQYAASGMTLGMADIDKELGVTNTYFSAIIVSVFLLSQGAFAMITSPLSEMYGRRIVMTASIFCLAVFNLGCAVTHDPYSLFVCRFFLGVSSSAPMAIGPSVISDLFDLNERGLYTILFGSVVNMAPVLGGLSSGLIVQYISWRWIFWVLVIVDLAAVVMGLLFINETYLPVLLKWKCRKLRKETGNMNLKTIYDIAELNETPVSRILYNIKRPISLLIGHPMVYGLGIFMAFLFGYFYLILISFPTVWREQYGYSYQTTGLMYLSVGAGYLVFNPFWIIRGKREYRELTEKHGGIQKPEFRIRSLWLCGIFCPIGLLIYGWCVEYRTFWFCPCIGVFLYTGFYTGMFSFLTTYIVDMNPRFSASSNAALSLFRSLFGFVFPIFAPKMYKSIGYGWGNTIFFFTGLLLGIPFPFYVYKYGELLRNKANIKFDRKQAERDARLLARAQRKLQQNI